MYGERERERERERELNIILSLNVNKPREGVYIHSTALQHFSAPCFS